MAKVGRTYINQSISFPPELLAAAKERAANLGLAFSAYVQKCIERDLAERGAIVYVERGAPLLAVAEDPAASTPATRHKTSKPTSSNPRAGSAR
jgi:hypothetical protein